MLRLAIIDDEVEARNAMIEFINWEMLGIIVIGVAFDGYTAYDLINTQKPDIVLIDIQMSGMTGIEVIEQVRKEGIVSPAFIIISGYDDFEYARKAVSLSVVEYLLKPFRPNDVMMAIQKSIKHLELIRGSDGSNEQVKGINIGNLTEGEGACFFTSLNYPAQKERNLLDCLKTNTLDAVLSELDVFWECVCSQNSTTKSRANCAIIFYVEVCRLLLERGSSFSNAYFENLNGLTNDVSQEIYNTLQLVITEAFSLIRYNDCSHMYVKDAIKYIHENYNKNLSLEHVAQMINVSAPYLSSLFPKVLGTNFICYVQSVRIENAKEMLLTTALKVYEIAYRVGYDDEKYFSQVFRKTEGISPSQFRSQSNVNLGQTHR